jgi:hypothetical protein
MKPKMEVNCEGRLRLEYKKLIYIALSFPEFTHKHLRYHVYGLLSIGKLYLFLMSQSFPPIQVEAESDNVTPQILQNALSKATSSDPTLISEGTGELSALERKPGFFTILQTFLINTSVPFEVRYLAAIQLKNGVDKYWRKTSPYAISKQEKEVIRSRCLEAGILEVDRRLALYNAIIVAKIVRHEYPREWPEVITLIVEHLQNKANQDPNSIHLPRTLLMLLHIVKELSTARLQMFRVNLQNTAPQILQIVGSIYVQKVNSWMNLLAQNQDITNDIDTSLLSLRLLRRLIISAFTNQNRNDGVRDFWAVLHSHFHEMIPVIMQRGQTPFQEQIEKHVIQISKLHLNMVKTHPSAFPQLPKSIEIAKLYWTILLEFAKTFGTQTIAPIGTDGDADEDVNCLEKLSLKGLLVLRACLKMVYQPVQTFKYHSQEDKEERKQSREAMKTSLLSEDMIREMMETLVTRFFVFRPKDLREWEEEPTEWEKREEGEGETWEFSIRVCSEKLFLDLVINNKDLLIQPLLQVLSRVATIANTNILEKDSIYAAVGLAAPVLEKYLDFDNFLTSTLVHEVRSELPGYNILRRRIAILLAQWIPVKEMDRRLVYQVFAFLLRKEPMNDLVVRVTAGRQIKNVIDPLDMQVELFGESAGQILQGIMELAQEVGLTETKHALLVSISTIVTRMESSVCIHGCKVPILID